MNARTGDMRWWTLIATFLVGVMVIVAAMLLVAQLVLILT